MDPAASCISCQVLFKMAFPMMSLALLPIPMRRTLRFLSRAIRWLAITAAMVAGSNDSVQRWFATKVNINGRSLMMSI